MVTAVIVCAGTGSRFGQAQNKLLTPLLDLPMVAHTLRAFELCDDVDGYVVVINPDDRSLWESQVMKNQPFHKLKQWVDGGCTRAESVWNGLRALSPETEIAVIHDGARVLITADLISKSIGDAKTFGSGVLGVSVSDTLKEVDGEKWIMKTIPRQSLFAMQTPQSFRRADIQGAYASGMQAGFTGTDDAGYMEYAGKSVKITAGDSNNIKITTPSDLLLAECVLRSRMDGTSAR